MSNERKIAWITGASSGIGRGLAIRLCQSGWLVFASSRNKKSLKALQSDCPNKTLHICPLDVRDNEETNRVVSYIEKSYGPINLAVLNAGYHIPVNSENMPLDPFQTLIETNYMGVVKGLASLTPRFIGRQDGQIAVIASLAGYRGLPNASAYGASKAAVINLCESLYPSFKRNNVKLTLINPGFVKTPLTDKNQFFMPFLISVDEAVDHIIRGLNGKNFEITFPSIFAFIMKIVRLLPYSIYFSIIQRISR